jgi:hypothetical protein
LLRLRESAYFSASHLSAFSRRASSPGLIHKAEKWRAEKYEHWNGSFYFSASHFSAFSSRALPLELIHRAEK